MNFAVAYRFGRLFLFAGGIMSEISKQASQNLEKLREQKPLIHNITNYVVMNYTANAILAAGALPVMAHAPQEMAEMVAIAGSLVINIGTLSTNWVEGMFTAGREANKKNIPIILDPVGAGATSYRTQTAKSLIDSLDIAVVRGNASEVLSLAGDDSKTKGVESIHSVDDAAEAAQALAKEIGCVVAITGKTDLVTDGEKVYRIDNGHALMGAVTGTGCVATTMIAAFSAVNNNFVVASAGALAYFGIAGEKAAEKYNAPGSYALGLIDELYRIGLDDLEKSARIEV